MTRKELIEAARKLASELNNTAVTPCTNHRGDDSSCLTAEEHRSLTKEERRNGWSMRPYDAYVPENMCFACRASWHVNMAAVILQDLDNLHKRLAADIERSVAQKDVDKWLGGAIA